VRAVVLNSFAGLDGLELSEVADPSPDAREELVSIRAASLGPWDRSAVDGAFAAAGGSSDFPQVEGWDFAGETTGGRRVLGFVAQPWMGVGAFAEQIAVPSAILAPLPYDLSFVEGSTLPVCTLTARLLVDAAAVKAGDLVLVTGAAEWSAALPPNLPVAGAPVSSPPCVTPTLTRRAGSEQRTTLAVGDALQVSRDALEESMSLGIVRPLATIRHAELGLISAGTAPRAKVACARRANESSRSTTSTPKR
jgi:hypothetical protein